MKKLLLLFALTLLAISMVAAATPAVDPYADAVKESFRTSHPNNALGAPDGAAASIKAGNIIHPSGYMILDMGEGEEIYGGPYGAKDFHIIEVDGKEIPDCASVGVWIADDSFHWVGLSCSSDGFELPSGAVVRYVKVENYLGTNFELDAIVADYYLPNNVPEFGVLAALGVIGLAGLFLYRKRK